LTANLGEKARKMLPYWGGKGEGIPEQDHSGHGQRNSGRLNLEGLTVPDMRRGEDVIPGVSSGGGV